MIDGIPGITWYTSSRPFYFYQKDIIGINIHQPLIWSIWSNQHQKSCNRTGFERAFFYTFLCISTNVGDWKWWHWHALVPHSHPSQTMLFLIVTNMFVAQKRNIGNRFNAFLCSSTVLSWLIKQDSHLAETVHAFSRQPSTISNTVSRKLDGLHTDIHPANFGNRSQETHENFHWGMFIWWRENTAPVTWHLVVLHICHPVQPARLQGD